MKSVSSIISSYHATNTMRMNLIEEYYTLYKERNAKSNIKFRENYVKMSEMWLEFSDKERTAVNIMMKQTDLPF